MATATRPTDLPQIEERLLLDWTRDLSTCLVHELEQRWKGAERRAIDRLDPRGFAGRLKDHHPLYYLAERCWFDDVADDPMFLHPPLHRDILAAMMEDYIFLQGHTDVRGALYLGPRDTFKSTFTQGVGPMGVALRWKHILGRDARQALTHHKEKMASQNLMRLKNKFWHHPWVRATWPEFCPPTAQKEWGTKVEFTFPCAEAGGSTAEASFIAAGLGASQTGGHFDVRWNDDIVTEDHIKSKIVRQDTEDRYGASRYTRDLGGGKEFNSGTRYHLNDLWSRLLKASGPDGKPMYMCRVVSAEEDDGTLAHPHRLPKEVLEAMRLEEMERRGNDIFYHLQMQNKVKTGHLVATDLAWIRYCKMEDVPDDAWRCILIDPAWKGTKNSGEGDYAAIAVMFFERRGSLIRRYLVDGVHSNELTQREGTDEIFRLMRRYGVVDVAPEEHGTHAFRQYLAEQGNERGMFINIIDLKSRFTNKAQRIVTMLSHIQAGNFFILDDCPVKQAFLGEYEDYPQVEHDDMLDAVAYSADENVAERIMPAFNPYVARTREAPRPPRRTRHCGL